MEVDLQSHVAFYLTGKKQSGQLDDIRASRLRPALFSGYRDLTRLRYDFPLVLVDDPAEDRFVEPLSGVIDSLLEKVARGKDAERIRKNVHRLEQEIRTRVADGGKGLLSKLWDQVSPALTRNNKPMADSLSLARANLKIDGEVVDCTAELPFRLIGHAWNLAQIQRAQRFNNDIDRLILKLSEIIEADFLNSDSGKSAENLKHAFGSGPFDNFNFEAMSHILQKVSPRETLSKIRRKRLLQLIATLQAQKFFPTTAAINGSNAPSRSSPYSFAFDTCSDALKAYRDRLPKAIELARAVAMAELEIRGEYSEKKHDPLFESFGENGLDADALAIFPDYLVRLNATSLSGPEQSTLTEIFSADLPIKILVQTDDILEESLIENAHLAFTLRSKQLARMAMGMGVFVLQSPASSLFEMRHPIQCGLQYSGAALFSIYSGDSPNTAGIPPYLVSAAARESRLLPAFCFNPAAGQNWATRFSLDKNPQAESDWPIHDIVYQDEQCQTVKEPTPFTLIDFVALDARYGKHFAHVSKAHWNRRMTPAASSIENERRGQVETVPYLLMVDEDNVLQRVLVDEKIIREARRCLTMWKSLQELGGIHNSHVEPLLAKERKKWEEAATTAALSARQEALPPESTASTRPTEVSPSPATEEAEPEIPPDVAYIESSRCSSCNECIQVNPKMFAFDENKQAHIADISAGTFAQLVEAAENCQVSIIHPGKPANTEEPGLDELVKRAEPFL